MILGILLTIVALANLWFLIKTLIIMSRNNALWAVGGFFFNPIVQIVYFFTQGTNLTVDDKQNFVRYFITFGLLFVFGIGFFMTLMSSLATSGNIPQ